MMYAILKLDIVSVNLEWEVNSAINVYQTTTDFQYWVVQVIHINYQIEILRLSKRSILCFYQNVNYVRNRDILATWIQDGACVLN